MSNIKQFPIPEWANHCHLIDDYEYQSLLEQEEEDSPWPEWAYVVVCLLSVGAVVVASVLA